MSVCVGVCRRNEGEKEKEKGREGKEKRKKIEVANKRLLTY